MTFERLENLNGRIAVVVGANGQVGKLAVTKLAAQGARVIGIVRKDVDTLQSRLSDLGNGSYAICADIKDTKTIRDAAEQIMSKEGRVDILINAAGHTRNIPPGQDLPDEIFDEIVATNLRGVHVTIREFKKLLQASSDAVVINISSVAGTRASQSNLAYAASKAGVDLMTKTLAKALAPIRFVGLAPSFLENPTSGAVKMPGTNERIAANTPLRRVGTGEDIANTILSMVMDTRFITGQTIIIDGGFTL